MARLERLVLAICMVRHRHRRQWVQDQNLNRISVQIAVAVLHKNMAYRSTNDATRTVVVT